MCYRILDKPSRASSKASRPNAGTATDTAVAPAAGEAPRRQTGGKTDTGLMERVRRWAAARRREEESIS